MPTCHRIRVKYRENTSPLARKLPEDVTINNERTINPATNTMLRNGEGFSAKNTSAASSKYTPMTPPMRNHNVSHLGCSCHLIRLTRTRYPRDRKRKKGGLRLMMARSL